MAILVCTYDTSSGKYLINKIGSAQISDGAIVSGKVASGAMTAGMIPVSLLSGATYISIQDLINNTQSAGRISGGAITATDPADGTVVVAAGTGFIKMTDSTIGVTKFFDWSEETALALTNNSANYIFVRYRLVNSTPTVSIEVTTDRTTIEQNREFTLGRVYRVGDITHIINSGIHLDNFLRLNHERLIQVRGFERASGGVISESGTRYLASTAGVFFLGANKLTTTQQDTAPNGEVDTLTRWYHDADGWVSNTSTEGASAAGQISNEHYDTGTALADIGPARYGVFWVFIHYDGDLHVVYGRGSYKLAEAEQATVPALPDAVSEFSILAAKIIIAKGGTNFTSIVTAYETLFPVSTPPDHNDLGGIQGGDVDDYYHLTAGEHAKAISPTFLALTDTPANFSGAANKVAAVNAGENALEFADPIPKTTDWKGSFNWDTSAYTTAETDISALFSTNLALTTRRKYSVKLDLTNVEADGSFDELYLAVKEKIDGTNYRAIDRKTITKAQIAATAEPGIPIDIPATSENIQITMQMKTALAGDVDIYYAVVKEHLE